MQPLSKLFHAAQRIGHSTHAHTAASFKADAQCVDSVLFNLLVIAEAIRSLPPELRDDLDEVRWTTLEGWHDIATRADVTIDLDLVWLTVTQSVPVLRHHVEKRLAGIRQEEFQHLM